MSELVAPSFTSFTYRLKTELARIEKFCAAVDNLTQTTGSLAFISIGLSILHEKCISNT